jgi:hypothetical protein
VTAAFRQPGGTGCIGGACAAAVARACTLCPHLLRGCGHIDAAVAASCAICSADEGQLGVQLLRVAVHSAHLLSGLKMRRVCIAKDRDARMDEGAAQNVLWPWGGQGLGMLGVAVWAGT